MFKKNDRVRLTIALEGFGVGAEGFVRRVDSRGNLIVSLDRNADGTVFDPPQPLLPHEPENFEKI